MKSIALEFATNAFGKLKPDIKKRLMAVLENPCQETWEDAYTIIINQKKFTTLWQAVIKIDSNMPKRKPLDSDWSYIPSREIIEEAIKQVVFKAEDIKNLN